MVFLVGRWLVSEKNLLKKRNKRNRCGTKKKRSRSPESGGTADAKHRGRALRNQGKGEKIPVQGHDF